MEGTWVVGDGEYASAVPHGGWEGADEQGAALPTTARSVGAVTLLDVTDYTFPLRSANEFVERVNAAPVGTLVRRWVLRDDNQRHHHGRVRLDEDPIYVELHWKQNARGKEQLVGLFRLHLRHLTDAGYARPEDGEPTSDEIRLRFYRGERGVICIQARHDQPALPIGVVDISLD